MLIGIDKGVAAARVQFARHPRLCLSLSLAVVAAIPFVQVYNFDFVGYDDNHYVWDNPHIKPGLTWDTFKWAFTGRTLGHWHPITQLSHQLDVTVFGMDHPGGHHVTSAVLHVLATVLLFWALLRLTGEAGPSALVAALFAIHPQHVEAVAWVSGRKDVLCAFFTFLTLLAYERYARQPSLRRYLWVFALCTLAVMSKVMAVTVPCVMLLLDYWPLRRLWPERDGNSPVFPYKREIVQLFRLGIEKLPLFLPVVVSSLFTYQSADAYYVVGARSVYPFSVRAGTSLLAFAQYIRRTFWPTGLSAFYPHTGIMPPMGQVAGSAALLVAVTVVAVLLWRKRPYLIVGWLWFVGMLIPVIGLVQSVHYTSADRYTYLPLIGFFIALVWGGRDLAGWFLRRFANRARKKKRGKARAEPPSTQPYERPLLIGVSCAIVSVSTVMSWFQTTHWRNNLALASQITSVTTQNAELQHELAMKLLKDRQFDAALAHYSESVHVRDYYTWGHYDKAVTLAKEGKTQEAIEEYRKSIENNPKYEPAHYNLANLFMQIGRRAEAIAQFEEALRLDPKHAETHYNLANVFVAETREDEAIAHFAAAIKLKPDYSEAYNNLGIALARQGKLEDALARFGEAIRMDAKNAEAHFNRANVLDRMKRHEDALAPYAEAVRLKPDYAEAHNNMGGALAALGRDADAAAAYRKAIHANPKYADAYANLGITLVRMGKRDEAIAALKSAIAIAPNHAVALRELQGL